MTPVATIPLNPVGANRESPNDEPPYSNAFFKTL